MLFFKHLPLGFGRNRSYIQTWCKCLYNSVHESSKFAVKMNSCNFPLSTGVYPSLTMMHWPECVLIITNLTSGTVNTFNSGCLGCSCNESFRLSSGWEPKARGHELPTLGTGKGTETCGSRLGTGHWDPQSSVLRGCVQGPFPKAPARDVI